MEVYEIEGLDTRFGELSDPAEVDLETASACLRLLANAYAHQFEKPNGWLKQGAFKEHFRPDKEDSVTSHADRMRAAIKDGSVYWFASQPDQHFETTGGLAKASPSRSGLLQRAHLQSPNCYLNDIVVAPAAQGNGIGRQLLLAVITSDHFDIRRNLTLDAFQGNEVANAWFQRLGMHAVEGSRRDFNVAWLPSDDPFTAWQPGAGTMQSLSQVRYTSEGQATMGDIELKLEEATGAFGARAAE
jgi:ribosomal protein S18 acetylase RimI-like enzyme